MKKVYCFIITVLCLSMLFSNVAFASAVDNSTNVNMCNVNRSDVNQIEQLLNSANVQEAIILALEMEGIVVSDASNIDWSMPLKIYLDQDILALDIDSKIEIMDVLEEANYCYVVSAFIDDYEVELTFSKGLPPKEGIEEILSPEQYQEIINNVGKWYLSSYGAIQAEDFSYYKICEEKNYLNNSDMIIVASQKGFFYPIILEFVDGVAENIHLLYDETAYDIIDEEYVQRMNTANIYSFEDVKEMTEEYEEYILDDVVEDSSIDAVTSLSMEEFENEVEITPMSTSDRTALYITRYAQEKDNWCWAACAKMLGKAIRGIAYSQESIVIHVQGSPLDVGVFNPGMKSAIQYAVGSNYSVSIRSVTAYNTLKNMICSSRRPFSIKVCWSGTALQAHYYVVDGANSGSTQELRLVDPWGTVSTKWYSYSALVNGTTLTSGTGSYTDTFLVN